MTIGPCGQGEENGGTRRSEQRNPEPGKRRSGGIGNGEDYDTRLCGLHVPGFSVFRCLPVLLPVPGSVFLVPPFSLQPYCPNNASYLFYQFPSSFLALLSDSTCVMQIAQINNGMQGKAGKDSRPGKKGSRQANTEACLAARNRTNNHVYAGTLQAVP
jgi:hypothetical protein